MKKRFCALMALVVFVVTIFLFNGEAFASTPNETRLGKSDTYYSYNSSTKTLTISGTGNMPVMSNSSTSIPWIEWNSDRIQRVVIEEGVTSVGNYAFAEFALREVILPSSLRTIGEYSFAGTYNTTEYVIPNGVVSIDKHAFENCTDLTSVSFPVTLKSIGESAFSGCTALESIEIPYSVSNIGVRAFYRCKLLNNVTFASLTQAVNMGTEVFTGCEKLMEIVLPMNMQCNTRFFGYESTTKKYTGTRIYAFSNSSAYNYANGNGISCTLIDTIPTRTGVEYKNTYMDDTQNIEYHYTFTPSVTQEYALYTYGECDTKGRLYFDGKLMDSQSDFDSTNSGFCFVKTLEKGKSYDIYIGSEKMSGDYCFVILPKKIASFRTIGDSIKRRAGESTTYGEKRIFSIKNSDIQNYAFELVFDDGTSFYTPYNSFIDGEYVKIKDDLDSQRLNPFTCGDNEGTIALGDKTASYILNISHEYSKNTVPPTEDNDGYDLHKCILCDDSYEDNFVETTAYTVTGKCVLSEHPILDTHENDIPYYFATIKIGNREYPINRDGTWEIHTFTDCYAVFQNQYGNNTTIKISVNDGSYDYGTVALAGYDFNRDGYISAKDFAIYKKEKAKDLDTRYWNFINDFIIYR